MGLLDTVWILVLARHRRRRVVVGETGGQGTYVRACTSWHVTSLTWTTRSGVRVYLGLVISLRLFEYE